MIIKSQTSDIVRKSKSDIIIYNNDTMIKYKNKDLAYFLIRFEQEAYNYQNDLGYIMDREKNAWKEYEV